MNEKKKESKKNRKDRYKILRRLDYRNISVEYECA